jgi:hypothetical protein
MEADTTTRLDSINMAELGRGFRFKALPEDLRHQLVGLGHPDIPAVVFYGQTPMSREQVDRVVQREYHKNLADEEIKSNAQLLELVAKRGEWTGASDERLKELQKRTNAQMTELYLEGFSSNGRVWLDQILAAASRFGQVLEECVALGEEADMYITPERRDEILNVFQRWLDFSPERHEEHTAKYAALQGKERYSQESDQMWLLNNYATLESVDLINHIEDLKDKLQRFLKFTREREELGQLQLKHAKIFAGSVESRRDNTEELARVYFTTKIADGPTMASKAKGPLGKTFDDFKTFPEDVIQWLLVENYFFHNAIPDEARPYLETFGFIRAEARNGESPASAESPEAPTSRTDSASAAATPEPSSVPQSA